MIDRNTYPIHTTHAEMLRRVKLKRVLFIIKAKDECDVLFSCEFLLELGVEWG